MASLPIPYKRSVGVGLRIFILSICGVSGISCTLNSKTEPQSVRLICLDPGHFHAALVQKYPNARLDRNVYVYAPEGPEVEDYLSLVTSFNQREEQPTAWIEHPYRGNDYLEKMLNERPGNTVLLAGNNRHKIDYLEKSVQAGLHVLADKPWIIQPDDFDRLLQTYEKADSQGLVIYDIMTERYEVLNRIQRELIQDTLLFGHLLPGSREEPSVVVTSIHAFYKEVAGQALTRPGWYYDVTQQGEGIVDVTTHLIDLVHWKCFPDQIIDYRTDIEVLAADHYPTRISKTDFTRSTGLDDFPDYLRPYLSDSTLWVNANGNIHYTVNGIHTALHVEWVFEHPAGSGDVSRTDIRGSRASTHIWQDQAQNYTPTLYMAPTSGTDPQVFQKRLESRIASLQQKFPGIKVRQQNGQFEISVPDSLKTGHEAHFAAVLDRYLDYVSGTPMPIWEGPNTLAKYYITTQALRLAHSTRPSSPTFHP